MRASVNFNLHNFTSDSKMLLEAMPIEGRLKTYTIFRTSSSRMVFSRTARVPKTEMES